MIDQRLAKALRVARAWGRCSRTKPCSPGSPCANCKGHAEAILGLLAPLERVVQEMKGEAEMHTDSCHGCLESAAAGRRVVGDP